MSNFPRNNSVFERNWYSVLFWAAGFTDGIDVYEYFCLDHKEALGLAASEHALAGRVLIGTRFSVEGPCHDHDRDCGGCGKNREIVGIICSEDLVRGMTN